MAHRYNPAAGQSATYDPRGNMTGLGAQTFSYSAENDLALTGASNRLYYDALHRLVYATSSMTRFDWDGDGAMTTIYDASGNLLRRYVHSPGPDEPLVWYEGTGTTDRRFLHADERGSVVATSNGSGQRANVLAYDDYGVPKAGNSGRFQYTGQIWLPELGMYYYKARIYNPAIGRFMQTDPIGYGDGLNWYDYAGSDPVNGADPSGRGDCVVPTGSHICSNNSAGGDYLRASSGFIVGGYFKRTAPNGPGVAGADGTISVTSSFIFVGSAATFGDFGRGSPHGLPAPAARANGASQNTKPASSKLSCLGSALYENKTGLGLDALGVAANLAFPEGSVGTAVAGSTVGVAGIAGAVIDNKGSADAAVAGGIAYTGKQAAVAEGLLRGVGSAVGHRIGVVALGASILYDVYKTKSDYNKCMSGD